MHSNYIVRFNDQLICFYHSKETGILCKKYTNGKWTAEKLIVKDARSSFSIALNDKKIYMFCQDLQGNILLAQCVDDEWNVKTALENNTQKSHTVLINPIIDQKSFTIIYNIRNDDRTMYLVRQQLQANGQWSPVSRIDKFIELPNRIYTVQKVSDDHMLLFYQTKGIESNLGYKEITTAQQGDFNVFLSTPSYITDTSFLTTNNAIHVLYVIKSMFSSQLVYRKKTGSQFGNPLVLYEGNRIENCLAVIAYDNVYVTFQVNSQLYVCMSEDMGATFSRPVKYRKKFCLYPIKATYISDVPQNDNLFFARDLYVDKTSPWDVQLAGELFEDFYPRPIVQQAVKPETPEPDSRLLLNQISDMQQLLNEKNAQVANMTSLLSSRTDELTRDMAEIRTLYKSAVSENKSLTEKLNEISSKYEVLMRENKEIIERRQMKHASNAHNENAADDSELIENDD